MEDNKIEELFLKAKGRFEKEAEPHWHLNNRITKGVIKTLGNFIEDDDQLIQVALLMGTEFE